MLRKLLSLFLLFALQQAYAQYIPTRSERSGNGPTPDNRGYVYNFGSDLEDNCSGSDGTNNNYNQFINPNYSCTLNTTLGYFNLSFTGSQIPTDLLVNHFTANNCQLIEFSSTGAIDMSEPQYQLIEARVRSNVAVDKFGMYIGITDENGFFQLGDGPGNTTTALAANTWTIVQAPAIFLKYDETPYDASKTIGLAFYAQNANDPQPAGNIEIDYVRVGSAAQTSIASGYISPSGNGYTFGFEGDEFHTCFNQMNVSANANFDYQVDQANDQLVITQADASAYNDIFSIEFTDQDCFLNTVDLTGNENKIIEIKVTSDQDVPSIGVAIMTRDANNVRYYSQLFDSFSLTAGVEKTITVPVHAIDNFGTMLDDTRVNGIALIVNPSNVVIRNSDRGQGSTTHYTIDYIKVGDVASTTTGIVPAHNNAIKLFYCYPNPTSGQLHVQLSDVANKEYNISLCDYTGQVVADYSGNSTDFNIDLSHYIQGIYLVKMISGTSVYTEKVILK